MGRNAGRSYVVLVSLLAVSVLVVSCSKPGASTAEASKRSVRVVGAGSTFAYPLYSKWSDTYKAVHPDVTIDYQPTGSGDGIRQVTQGSVDFGASDGPMNDDQIRTFEQKRGCRVLHFPTALGADVPTYNISGVNTELKFTSDSLAGIYLGRIRKWNDPELVKVNPGVALPDSEIIVVHRSDGSGTTYVWTDYLSKISEEWKVKFGTGTSVNWPVGVGAKGNDGVIDVVRQTPNSLGYVELTYAIQNALQTGQVQNSAGKFIKANVKSVTAAAAQAASSMPDDFRLSITNAPGNDAYPIATFTWLLVPSKIDDAGKKTAITDFLLWSLSDGQIFAEPLAYARLPQAVIDKEQRAVVQIQ
jgi:phosphate transport system substrate-binding protein